MTTRDDKLPVTIIAGFLGSGKTTLVNYILTNQRGLKTAVLVNEFGAVGIDGALIVSAEDDMVELSNGCICCTMNDGLMEAIFRVLERPEPLDYLVVETSGLAEPLPVAQTFLRPEFRQAMHLDAILTLADAENFNLERFSGRTARNQLLHGDIVLLNKCDLVSPARLQAVEAAIRSVKHDARIIRTTRAQVPLPLILDIDLFEHGRPETCDGHDHGPGHLEQEGFTALSFVADRPLVLARFQEFLNQLPANVFRAKGILWIDERPGRFVFQLTGARFDLEEGEWTGLQQNRLVLLGQNLDNERLQAQLQACLVD